MDYNKSTDILIVDDDKVNNFIAEKLIKQATKNANITFCLNGQDAIERLLTIKQNSGTLPGFIFLDLNMPVMDGWHFLDEYNRLNLGQDGQSEIFIISSSIFRHDIERALGRTEVKEYISKPMNLDLICRILKVDHLDN